MVRVTNLKSTRRWERVREFPALARTVGKMTKSKEVETERILRKHGGKGVGEWGRKLGKQWRM
jgi:hypothetical protein